MAEISENSISEVAYLLTEILQVLNTMQADLAGVRKAIENGGDLDHRLGYIEAGIGDVVQKLR